jgi:hypothetical protein
MQEMCCCMLRLASHGQRTSVNKRLRAWTDSACHCDLEPLIWHPTFRNEVWDSEGSHPQQQQRRHAAAEHEFLRDGRDQVIPQPAPQHPLQRLPWLSLPIREPPLRMAAAAQLPGAAAASICMLLKPANFRPRPAAAASARRFGICIVLSMLLQHAAGPARLASPRASRLLHCAAPNGGATNFARWTHYLHCQSIQTLNPKTFPAIRSDWFRTS